MSEDMTWTPDKVEALAKDLDEASAYGISMDLGQKAASALTWALERIKEAQGNAAGEYGMRCAADRRAHQMQAERDAANARAGDAAACMQVLVSCARPYLQDGHEHQNREYLLHALDDAVQMIADLRALKEAGK